MVHCGPTCCSHSRPLVSLATWYRICNPRVQLAFWNFFLLIGVLMKAIWIPGQGCTITQTDSKLLAATFIYSMAFDLLVLILTAYKLLYPATGRSRLVELIFNDGLIFFVIALVWLILSNFIILSTIFFLDFWWTSLRLYVFICAILLPKSQPFFVDLHAPRP